MTTSTYGNGVVNTYTYRPDNLVSSIEVKDGSNTVLDKSIYAFDANKADGTEDR